MYYYYYVSLWCYWQYALPCPLDLKQPNWTFVYLLLVFGFRQTHDTFLQVLPIQLAWHRIHAFCIDSIRFEYYTNIITLDSIQKMKLCSCNKWNAHIAFVFIKTWFFIDYCSIVFLVFAQVLLNTRLAFHSIFFLCYILIFPIPNVSFWLFYLLFFSSLHCAVGKMFESFFTLKNLNL